jgi:hypothetical protein
MHMKVRNHEDADNGRRVRRLQVLCSRREAALIAAAARQLGRTTSDYLRWLGLKTGRPLLRGAAGSDGAEA